MPVVVVVVVVVAAAGERTFTLCLNLKTSFSPHREVSFSEPNVVELLHYKRPYWPKSQKCSAKIHPIPS